MLILGKIEDNKGGRLTQSAQYLPFLRFSLLASLFPLCSIIPDLPDLSRPSLFSRPFGQDLVKIILAISFCLFCPLLIAEINRPDKEIIQILKKEYSDWQGNRSEKLIIFCQDGQIFRFSNNNQNRVSIRLADIIRTLARNGNSLASVSVITHNHKWPDDFSEEDRSLLITLRKYGFRGRFLVYYPERRLVKELTDPGS